ncbi:DUF4357 domain-containing protein [Flavobacterium rhizosphaerae]|uniref:DUF4357 domain-containing protein n=1 Tax=Flavobacterium rhizosphaerae TaxID=3163298 RepID=A0ABW8YW08_9FLAO
MEDFIINVKVLNGVFGHKFLENPVILNNKSIDDFKFTQEKILDSNEDTNLFLNVKDLTAKAIQTDEGIVVLKRSQVAISSRKFGYSSLRDKLITDKIISTNSLGELYFTKNCPFSSPSAAAAVILGYSVNGRNIWRNSEGKSLKEIENYNIK